MQAPSYVNSLMQLVSDMDPECPPVQQTSSDPSNATFNLQQQQQDLRFSNDEVLNFGAQRSNDRSENVERRLSSSGVAMAASNPTSTYTFRASARFSSTPENLLVLESIQLAVSNRSVPLLTDASVSIAAGHRYGLIGSSRECGKSTLLKAIASKQGMKIPNEMEISLCDQSQVLVNEPPGMADYAEARVVDFVLQQEQSWIDLKNREQALELTIRKRENVTSEVYAQLKLVYEQLCFVASGQAETKARLILSGLGFSAERQNLPLKELSPSRRMIVGLARMLYLEPAILLIDRPTNYLDVDGIVWLESYLKIWPTTLIINTQDRSFLDAVCSKIIFMNGQQLFSYNGNFSAFRRQMNGR